VEQLTRPSPVKLLSKPDITLSKDKTLSIHVVYNACRQLHSITIKGRRYHFSSFRNLQEVLMLLLLCVSQEMLAQNYRTRDDS
jgi:hypothetical protein